MDGNNCIRGEQADWIDEDLLDLEGVLVPPEIRTETAMHVYLLEEHLQCPWVEDVAKMHNPHAITVSFNFACIY